MSSQQLRLVQRGFVVIWGDDIWQSHVSAYTKGSMGYQTPSIDRIAKEGVMFTDSYAEQSCTAGRSSFITGQTGLRAGNTQVGLLGAALGYQVLSVERTGTILVVHFFVDYQRPIIRIENWIA